jgi:hypothetical protein
LAQAFNNEDIMFDHANRSRPMEQLTRALRASSLLAGAVLAFSGCHSTELATTWNDPTGHVDPASKTVAVFVTTDPVMRHSIEDRIAARFPNTVPSYQVLDSTTGGRPELARQLRESGFGNAIMMRLVRVDQNVTYTAGSYWYGSPYSFSGYWSHAWADPYNPVAYVDQVVVVDTEIYSLHDEKLVFGARSETTNPASTGKLVESIMRHVNKELHDKGLMRTAAR